MQQFGISRITLLFIHFKSGRNNSTGWPKKLQNEMCSRYLSEQRNKQCQTHKIVQIHSETVLSVSSLLLDDTFQPVTPLIDGVVSEALRQFTPPRDDCTLELLDCSESSPA